MSGRTHEVRRIEPVDALERDGELLVLVGGRVVLVSPVGRAIVRTAGQWIGVGDLAGELEREFGRPADGDLDGAVEVALAVLAAEGLVEVR